MGRIRRRGEGGQATLQTVVVFPAVLLIIGVVLQTALWFTARNTALHAAREGVRAARVQHATPGQGRAAALQFARQVGSGMLLSPGVRVTRAGSTLVVRVTGAAPTFVPGLHLTVSQVARGPVERFTTPGGGSP